MFDIDYILTIALMVLFAILFVLIITGSGIIFENLKQSDASHPFTFAPAVSCSCPCNTEAPQ